MALSAGAAGPPPWRRRLRLGRLAGRNALRWLVSRPRRWRAGAEDRAALDADVALRSAEDVARELGDLKGAVMKLGQLLSFVAEGLPPEARAALSRLQQDVPPMAPELAASVVRAELGDEPERLFRGWDPRPVAAASIGQVHRAVLDDGRAVAVKVQYPGVGEAIRTDLAGARALYTMVAATAMRGLDAEGIVSELREHLLDELDYRLEARSQQAFADRFAGHPFVRVPAVVTERSSERVLTSEWAGGATWSQFQATADPDAHQRAAEVLFRFAQRSIHLDREFNGDPHPGNYRFHDDGTVTFLDFGLVKRWTDGEWEALAPVLDRVLAADAGGTVRAMEAAGFIRPDHGLAPDRVFGCVSAPYVPYLTDRFSFSPAFTAGALAAVFDITGPYGDVIGALRLPPSFVVLHRVVWGVSALLGRLGAGNRWGAILDEYRLGAPPATELGRTEAAWSATRR